jgi:hypothetical protein
MLFLYQKLRYSCALPRGDLLHSTFIEVAIRSGLIHFPALCSKFLNQSGHGGAFRLPQRTNLLPLPIAQIQFVGHIAHCAKVAPSVARAPLPTPPTSPGNSNASHCQHYRQADYDSFQSNISISARTSIRALASRACDKDWLSHIKFCKGPCYERAEALRSDAGIAAYGKGSGAHHLMTMWSCAGFCRTPEIRNFSIEAIPNGQRGLER